jgi:cholinesterase
LATGASPTATETSEDCLFLNIYAPTNATAQARLPVFFYIQGGGFNSNSNPDIDGSGLIAASNFSIVVVDINYRVGPYGFLTDGTTLPNNGLRDQRKALEWVQNHIALFGGDPDHVVIGGESAGAASVSLQMTAYGGKDFGLFHGAAAESVSFANLLTVNETLYMFENLAIQAGCVGAHPLACLRNLTAAQLQAVNQNIPFPGAGAAPLYMWGPTIDGDLVPDYTYAAFANGKFVRVPAIFGDDTNGGTVFAPSSTSTLPASNAWLHTQFPALTLDQLAQVDALYPNPNAAACPASGCYWRQLSNAYGEMRYMCPGLYISSVVAAAGSPSWAYRYNVEDPAQMAQGLGVPHTVESNAIFGPLYVPGTPPASYYANGANAAVIPVIQAYWTSFIRTLDPNTNRYPGSVNWKAWSENMQERILFNTSGVTAMEAIDSGLANRCSFWADNGVSIQQ